MAKSKTYEMMLKIAGKADGSLKKACAAASQNLETLGNAAKTAGKVVAGASLAIVGATATIGTAALEAGKEYQAQLANISTLLTGTEAEVAARTTEIGDQILDVSNRTGVATDNLTDGMYQVISAFGDSADASSILETAAKSAAAGNATTADSINLLSAVTKGYGDTSAEAVQKAADLSFATVRLGQTSFPELASSMGKVIPLASTLGLEQEQLFGAMATLTGVTGSTAEVVTQLKATMQGFLSPSKNMKEALKSMGYESGQALLESEGLQGALDALKNSVHGDELAFAGLFSSVEAQTAVLAMAGTQSENLAMKTAEMYEAAGAADTAFQRQTKNLKYTIQTVKNLGQNFLTQLGTNILPYVSDLAEKAVPKVQRALESAGDYVEKTIIPTAEKAVKWIGENKTAILAVAGAAATAVGAFKGLQVASAAVGAVKNLSTIFKAGAKSGGLLSKVLGMGNVKLALIAGVIALVAAGFVLLWNKSEKFRATVSMLWSQLKILGQYLAEMASTAWGKVAPLFAKLGDMMLNGLERATELLAPIALGIIGALMGIAEFITGVFSGDWDKALRGLKSIFWNVLGGMGGLAVAGFTAILEIGSAIWPVLDNIVLSGITAIGERFPLLGAYLQGWWSSIQATWTNVQAIFSNIIDFIDNVFAGNWSAAWQNIVDIFGNLFGGLVNLAKAPINGVISAINFVLEKVNGISVTIPDWVPGMGGKALGFNIPTIPQLAAGGIATAPTLAEIGEGGEPEAVLPLSKLSAMLQEPPGDAPLAQLAKMLDDWTKNPTPGQQGPDMGGNDSPPPEGGQNPQDDRGDNVTFVFHYHGTASPEQAKEAGKIGFTEFKRLYQQMKAEERRKNLRASTC